jgi:hypothetical protein
MTKPSRRKKAKPVKNRRLTFRISLEAQEMTVSYHPQRMADMGQFEFRSLHKPPRRIPIKRNRLLFLLRSDGGGQSCQEPASLRARAGVRPASVA